MGAPQFTPGTWEVRPCKSPDGKRMELDICLPLQPGMDGVAVIASIWGNNENANLIASAPELYEALEECVGKLRKCLTHAGNADFAVDACCEQFENALAKARGEVA